MKDLAILFVILALITFWELPEQVGGKAHQLLDAMENHSCPTARTGGF
jgi:hypothetical protein